jgi:two-component system, sensor histidine kinase RegB
LNTTATFSARRSDPDALGGAVLRLQRGNFHALRQLAFLRLWAPMSQVITLWVVTRYCGVEVPPVPLAVLFVIQALVAVATWARVRASPDVSEMELLAQVHLDILMFAAVLYYTGGVTNPFAPLFVLPFVIVASALAPRWVWLTAISTMLVYGVLREYRVHMQHPNGETQVYELHEDGMVANYVVTIALLAFFCNRMHGAMRRHELNLANARDAQMRSESVVAIGALAAGYAHELSSPLSTMAVVVAELKRARGADTELQHDLQVIEEQLAQSKQIISRLTLAGGERRAEAMSGARLDQFIQSIVERTRAVHAGATIVLSLDAQTPAPHVVVEETLRQAITNLIDNAVRVSPHHVELAAGWSDTDLRITVRDHGPGFPPDVLNRLGRPVVGPTRHGDGGLGLGLLLTAATLERLGGTLVLRNPPEGGAHCEVRVPLRAITINPEERR